MNDTTLLSTENIANFNILLTNARSLQPKIESLMDYFSELNSNCALISEMWLKENTTYEKMKTDVCEGEGVGMIAKHRNKVRRGVAMMEGGVAIMFKKDLLSLKEYQLRKSEYEVVAVVGKLPNVKRRLLIISIYAPPNLKPRQRDGLINYVADAVDKGKRIWRPFHHNRR